MDAPDEAMHLCVIKQIRLRLLDRDPTIRMHTRVLGLSRYNSFLKARARSDDPVDFGRMWSMRDVRLDHIWHL